MYALDVYIFFMFKRSRSPKLGPSSWKCFSRRVYFSYSVAQSPFSFSCMSLAAINRSLAPGCVDSREEDQNVIEESAAVGPAAVALGQTPSNLVSYLCSNQSE